MMNRSGPDGDDAHPSETDWPVLVMGFKSALQHSCSIATPMTGLRPHNPVIVHLADAAAIGLKSGDPAWFATPGGRGACSLWCGDAQGGA